MGKTAEIEWLQIYRAIKFIDKTQSPPPKTSDRAKEILKKIKKK